MKKLYYYQIPEGENKVEPVLTFDYNKAKDKQGFRLANLEDLEFAICAGEEPYEGEIEVKEGIVKWTDKVSTDIFGEVEEYGEYELVRTA